MIKRLTNPVEIEEAGRQIRELIAAHSEWFCARDGGRAPVTLRGSECDLGVSHSRLIFSCWGDDGAQSWRIVGWEWTGVKLLLEAIRRLGAERTVLELIPRTSSSAVVATISKARHERCNLLAGLACAILDGARVERAALSAGVRRGQPGRYARILLRLKRERIAVTGIVALSEAHQVDAFLSSALVWFTRAAERSHAPYIRRLWLIVEREMIEPVQHRLALLRDDLRRIMTVYEIDDTWRELTQIRVTEMTELWVEPPGRFPRFVPREKSAWAARIIAHAPDAIDVARARHGETLRYHGLPFARVRRVMKHERLWFGIEGARRRLLEESTWPDWTSLLSELKENRRADASDHRHALYRAAPEAWLESLLRRDITRLDPGLVIAPLHAQFRTSQAGAAGPRPVDLLALRQDGRLVVIELKVSEDREHVLQGADYWRRVEAHRRHGNIERARLFGEAVIADEPPLVYLVAPTLRFHRAFHTLAHSIAPAIEIYRFDINEDWRTGVRVMRRTRAGLATGISGHYFSAPDS